MEGGEGENGGRERMEGGEGENGERERMEGGREWRVCLVGRKDVFCYMGGWLTRCRPILRSLPLPHTRILTHKLSLAHTHPHPHLSRSHDDLTMIDLTALPLIPVTHPTPHPGSPTLPLTPVTHPTPIASASSRFCSGEKAPPTWTGRTIVAARSTRSTFLLAHPFPNQIERRKKKKR